MQIDDRMIRQMLTFAVVKGGYSTGLTLSRAEGIGHFVPAFRN
jgi:hypothetical protein